MQMAAGDARMNQVHVLEVKKSHVRDLASILKAISFRENGTFQATPQGMRIIVDDSHCQQAIAYLSNDLFSSFNLRERSVHFRIPLNVVAECIGMHTGSGATLKMTYDGAGEPVRLILEEDGIVVDMNVQTLTTEEILDFEFDAEDVTFQVIMKSGMLKEAIKVQKIAASQKSAKNPSQEPDMDTAERLHAEIEFDASSSTVTLSVSADELSLTTTGEIGKAVTKFPRFSEQIERLDCAEPVVHQYPLSLIRKMSTAFAIANKVSLRCDSRGVLSCQFMVEQAERKQVYIEFYCVPFIED